MSQSAVIAPHLYTTHERLVSRALLNARLPRDLRTVMDRVVIRYPLPWEFRMALPILGGAANTSPLFALTPNVGFATITAANTATDGTGTVAAIFTAGTNGSRVDRIRCVPLGTNVASKAYIFVNNGGAQGTAANNALILDIPLPSTTASNTALIGAPVEFTIALALKSSYVLNATLATAVAAGWKILGIGGDY